MPFKTYAVAECKKEAVAFIQRHFMPHVEHLLSDACMLSDGASECHQCPGRCTFDTNVRPHLTTAGLPCQPFSKMRWKNGPGKNEKAAVEHKAWAVFKEFWHYLALRKPYGFILEEVEKILDEDKRLGSTVLDLILTETAKLGYGCSAVSLHAVAWFEVPRSRHRGPNNVERYSFVKNSSEQLRGLSLNSRYARQGSLTNDKLHKNLQQ